MKPMTEPLYIETIREHLFDSLPELQELKLRPQQIERILRVREYYNYWLRYPTVRDKEIVSKLCEQFNLPRHIAYRDLAIIKTLLGDLGKTSKDFVRFQFNEMLRDTYDMAKRDHNVDAMQKCLNLMGKYNKLDKDDILDNRWDLITPQTFELTDDPSVIGFKPIPNIREKIKAKLHQYWHDGIEDVQYVEVNRANELIKPDVK